MNSHDAVEDLNLLKGTRIKKVRGVFFLLLHNWDWVGHKSTDIDKQLNVIYIVRINIHR